MIVIVIVIVIVIDIVIIIIIPRVSNSMFLNTQNLIYLFTHIRRRYYIATLRYKIFFECENRNLVSPSSHVIFD